MLIPTLPFQKLFKLRDFKLCVCALKCYKWNEHLCFTFQILMSVELEKKTCKLVEPKKRPSNVDVVKTSCFIQRFLKRSHYTFSFTWYMRGLTASLHYRIPKTEHTVESFNSVENCFILFRMCSYIRVFLSSVSLLLLSVLMLQHEIKRSSMIQLAHLITWTRLAGSRSRRSPIRILQKCIKYSESFKVFALIHLKC